MAILPWAVRPVFRGGRSGRSETLSSPAKSCQTITKNQEWRFGLRNAALTLGLIGGILAMIVGFFGYGYTVFVDQNGEIGKLATQVNHPLVIKTASFLAPILAIAGAAMARSQNIPGGILMLASCVAMWFAFGFGVFTMFPIAMCGLGGILALAARQPDTH